VLILFILTKRKGTRKEGGKNKEKLEKHGGGGGEASKNSHFNFKGNKSVNPLV